MDQLIAPTVAGALLVALVIALVGMTSVGCRKVTTEIAAGSTTEPSAETSAITSAKTSVGVSLVPADLGRPHSLPLPSSLSVAEYERHLFEFLNRREYKTLGWIPDKRVRDTGPYIKGKYYGTHPAVSIFYSPEIVRWLQGGKLHAIPNGAMIVKEQYEPPAARYAGLDEDKLFEQLSSWTVMVKDAAGSHDGWFWSNPAKDQKVVDNHQYPFDHPISGFGIYCVRCHASTRTVGETNEYTFAALRNIQGFPGEPLLFRVDDSWRKVVDHQQPATADTPTDDNSGENTDENTDESNEYLLTAKLKTSDRLDTSPLQ